MAIVDFSKITAIPPSQVKPIIDGQTAMGNTGDNTRPTLYDPLWGYFVFGQNVSFEYADSDTYLDVATFTIQGVFSRDAEVGDDATDEQAFNALMARYMALEKKLSDLAKAQAPANYALWGTSSDPRCLSLPAPLLDKDGKPVMAVPVSLQIDRTQFAVEIKYTATLREAVTDAAKLVVNGIIIDEGEVTITCPQPVMARHDIVGTSGQVLQLKNYKAMELEVSGRLPLVDDGRAVSADALALASSLERGKVSLAAATRSRTQELWNDLDVVEEAAVEADYGQQVMSVQMRARE